MIKAITIGKHTFKPVIAAPLSGVTDFPFRKIINSFGGDYSISEMIASQAMIMETKKSLKKAAYERADGKVYVVQLAGCEPHIMGEAARLNADAGADIIDINYGCPIKKVVNGNAGSALMKQPELALRIIESVVKSVKIPVTVKMRTGWDSHSLNAPELAKKFESAGVSLIVVHGRTRNQLFDGKADWKFISTVKESVKIPVIVNGDIKTFEDGDNALKESNADGIMIGRGIYGKPWLIADFLNYFEGRIKSPRIISQEEVGKLALHHFSLIIDFYGKEVAPSLSRKHLAWYTSGMPGGSIFRAKINMLNDISAIEQEMQNFFFSK